MMNGNPLKNTFQTNDEGLKEVNHLCSFNQETVEVEYEQHVK
jgi:hypothetical protein